MLKSKGKLKIDGKAQAALEFLTTYGWAFLVILIMIGALAYFGILSPSKILPSRCNFGSELQCLDFQINSSGLKVRLKNSVGEPITVDTATVSTESPTAFTCIVSNSSLQGWISGGIKDITWNSCNSAAVGLIQGEKGKVFITVKYYSVSSGIGYAKEVKGEIYSSVI